MIPRWARYVIGAVAGIAIGSAAAVHMLRGTALGSDVAIGPWATGRDFATEGAGAKTRAAVALRGLLALPASEARYYNAATDDAGRPLDGHCRYRVSGGELPAAWWSLTLFDREGYLVGDGPYSIEGAALPAADQRNWSVTVSPTAAGKGLWLPTDNVDRFELTLRLYLPANGGTADLARATLPSIVREACA